MLTLLCNVLVFRAGKWRPTEILIAGGKIARVSDRVDCVCDGLVRVDGYGLRAVAGYIDQHVHITGGGGEGGFSNRVPPVKTGELVRAGTSTVVGMLGTDAETRSVESVVAKARAIREEGLTAFCLTGAYRYPSPTVTGSVLKDIVMINEIIGVKIAIADHRASYVTKRELAHLASEARQGGILSGKAGYVCLHTGTGKQGLEPLFRIVGETDIPVSVFRPTHLGNKLEAALRFADMGGYIDFTAGEDADASASVIAEALERAPEGLVTVSSDAGGSVPVWNENREMTGMGVARADNLARTVAALVTGAGVPLEKAVLPVTENAAKALSIYPRKGCIAEGADADILLLNDSLEPDTLIAGGKLMLRGKSAAADFKFEN